VPDLRGELPRLARLLRLVRSYLLSGLGDTAPDALGLNVPMRELPPVIAPPPVPLDIGGIDGGVVRWPSEVRRAAGEADLEATDGEADLETTAGTAPIPAPPAARTAGVDLVSSVDLTSTEEEPEGRGRGGVVGGVLRRSTEVRRAAAGATTVEP